MGLIDLINKKKGRSIWVGIEIRQFWHPSDHPSRWLLAFRNRLVHHRLKKLVIQLRLSKKNLCRRVKIITKKHAHFLLTGTLRTKNNIFKLIWAFANQGRKRRSIGRVSYDKVEVNRQTDEWIDKKIKLSWKVWIVHNCVHS